MSRVPIRTIITTWKACQQNYSATDRQLGIDRRARQPWGYVRWQGVRRQSTAPKASQAGALRRGGRLGTGLAGGHTSSCREKLAFPTKAQGLTASSSTIHRTLQRARLIRPSTKRRRSRFQNGQVMRTSNCPGLGYLQMDVKYATQELSGLPCTCYLYAAMDIQSRNKVGLIQPKVDEANAGLAGESAEPSSSCSRADGPRLSPYDLARNHLQCSKIAEDADNPSTTLSAQCRADGPLPATYLPISPASSFRRPSGIILVSSQIAGG